MGDDDHLKRWQALNLHVASTAAVAPHERFDFWRSLFGDTTMAPLERNNASYEATVLSCAGDDGFFFADMGCDPTSASFTGGGAETIQLTMLTRGCINVSDGDDERTVVAPNSGLYLFDYARRSNADSPTGYHSFMVQMPRALVYQVMGDEPISAKGAVRSLPETPLSVLLKDTLHSLSRQSCGMNAQELDAAMKAISGLTIAYLQRFNTGTGNFGRADESFFAAACAYIDACKGRRSLTAARVASALGCSRARLYRSFGRRGLAVSHQIRQARLNHSRTLLRDPALDMCEVALRSGYADLSAFGKAFRRTFGMSPRDWRGALAKSP